MNVLKWMEEIQVIKGYTRVCLYDLPRGNFRLADKTTQVLIDSIEGKTMDSVQSNLDSTEKEWLNEFKNSEYLFEVPESTFKSFPTINFQWETPFRVLSSFIDKSSDLELVIPTLEQTGCKHLWIVFDTLDIASKEITKHLEYSYFLSIEIQIEKHNPSNNYESFLKKHPTISNIHINDESFKSYSSSPEVSFSSKKTKGKPLFQINLLIFSESKEHNVFFNRKIYFTGSKPFATEGTDCRINDNFDEPKIWLSSKDKTDICKHCEYRYMCVDNRIPVMRKENEWYHDTECNYNPYIAKWENEENYKTLIECGVISNKNEFSFNHEKIAEINKELWGE